MKQKNFEIKPVIEVIHGFNPLRDVKEIEDGLSVDINDMLRTGIVKDSSATLDNNGIDDPNQIIGMVRDEFAAIDAMRAIRKYGRKKASVKAEPVIKDAAGAGAPAPTNE